MRIAIATALAMAGVAFSAELPGLDNSTLVAMNGARSRRWLEKKADRSPGRLCRVHPICRVSLIVWAS